MAMEMFMLICNERIDCDYCPVKNQSPLCLRYDNCREAILEAIEKDNKENGITDKKVAVVEEGVHLVD